MKISPQEALGRIIEHREIFHDEMLHIMRLIMRGEMSAPLMAAFIAALRVKKETIGEITAAAQVMRIRELLDARNCGVPLVGDFHFNGHKLLADYPGCAEALARYRINPGNVGRGAKRDDQFGTMIEAALRYEKPVRIGVNWGSLDPELLARLMDENASRAQPMEAEEVMREALIVSALDSAAHAEKLGLGSVLSFDMGGTTAKICLIEDAKPTDAPAAEFGGVAATEFGGVPAYGAADWGAAGGAQDWGAGDASASWGDQTAGAYPTPH